MQPKLSYSSATPIDSVLVLVDMQKKFPASTDPAVIQACANLITNHMRRQSPIIIAEFGDPKVILPPHSIHCGDTHRSLMDLLLFPRRYDKLAVVEKLCNDGSAVILRECTNRGFATSAFRVCGVNSDACVSETVYGLAVRRHKSQIEVITEACNTEGKSYNWRKDCWEPYNWNHFPALPNIVLVRPALTEPEAFMYPGNSVLRS